LTKHRVLPGTILDVCCEAVVADIEKAARRIIAYCGLPCGRSLSLVHKTGRPVRIASATQSAPADLQERRRPLARLLKELSPPLADSILTRIRTPRANGVLMSSED
jgi:hypothetical protein